MEAQLAPLIGAPAAPVAALLAARFGTTARVLAASPEALADALRDYPEAAARICAARALIAAGMREELVGQVVDVREPRLHEYLRTELLNPTEERMHVIYLDRNGRFLAAETIARGGIGRVLVQARQLVHRALDLGANRLLLAHNHPSGTCHPSADDRRSTEHLSNLFAPLDMVMDDHLIVSARDIFSIKLGRIL